MSNAQEHHSDEEPQAFIKTPRQLILVVILAFLVPILIMFMLINYVNNQIRTGAGSDAMTTAAIDARVAPVAGFELVDASAPQEFLTGDAVYEQVCAACHTSGVAGAPVLGNAGEWAPRLEKGYDTLLASSINGLGAMPPKGGAAHLSDFEIERAMVYLANESGASFDEPQSPEAEGEGEAAATEEAASDAAATQAATEEAATEEAVEVAAQDIHQEEVDATAEAEAATLEGPAEVAESGQANIPEAQEQQDDPALAQAEVQAGEAAAEQDAADGQIVISADAQTVGKQLYESVCMACHAAGVAGAPKIGDSADWAPYIATGMDTMLAVSITGKGAMPPRGGAANATDDQLRAAIEYMIADAL